MIASTNRFASSGGGGGGSNRNVVFTLSLRDGGMSRELDAIGKKVDEIARKAGNIRFGGDGSALVGAPAAGGVAASGRASARNPRDDSSRQNRLRAQELARIDRETEFYRKRNEQSQRQADRAAAQQARRDFLAIDRQNKAFESRRTSTRTTGGGGSAVLAGGYPTVTRGQFGEALEGVTSLARAFVLLGVSSEENMAKAVRALAKFEAAAQGIRGVLKVSEPLGALLMRGGGALGLKAGGGAMAVGGAGLAAGVGLLGGGLAIADQIRYSRTGEIGAFSQAHSGFITNRYRDLHRWGLTSEDELKGSRWSLTTPQANLAASSIAYEKQLLDAGWRLGGLAERGAFDLANARADLSETERMYNRQGMRRAYATEFQGLSRGGQRRLLRMRDRYFDNPDAMKSRDLLRIRGALGPAEQEALDARLEARSGDLFGRGFDDLGGRSVPPIKLDEVLFKREVVGKLEIQNEAVVKRMEDLLKEAIKTGNEDLQARFEKMIAGVQANIDNTNTNFQNSQNTIGNLRGY